MQAIFLLGAVPERSRDISRGPIGLSQQSGSFESREAVGVAAPAFMLIGLLVGFYFLTGFRLCRSR